MQRSLEVLVKRYIKELDLPVVESDDVSIKTYLLINFYQYEIVFSFTEEEVNMKYVCTNGKELNSLLTYNNYKKEINNLIVGIIQEERIC